MAARPPPPPWPPLLSLLLVGALVISLVPFSSSSASPDSLSESLLISSSPQNIQTFYPFFIPPPPPPSRIPPRQQQQVKPLHHSYRRVVKAVVATATGTTLVSALFFFLLVKHTNKKKKKQPNAADPIPPDLVRVNSGVILEEEGLDTLFWKKGVLKGGGKARTTFNKHLMCSNFVNKDEEEDNGTSFVVPMQERPLLSDRDSVTLEKKEEQEDQSTTTTTTTTAISPPIPPPPKGPPPPPPAPSSLKPLPPAARTRTETSPQQQQVKMKPLHWDKLNPHNVDHSMVWHRIQKGSFKVNDDQMEALFADRTRSAAKQDFSSSSSIPIPIPKSTPLFILDPRKSQNIAIVVRSLPISRKEISDSLIHGHGLNLETLERLARIAPTHEEEAAVLQFSGDPEKLADAESFLYHLLRSVPAAFSRLNAMLFRSNFEPETLCFKESLRTLEQACNDLKTRRIFLKLLEAVLKAGNRMNAGTTRGNAQAFNLTALRKLSDVKSCDGKTTLLHFIVEEVVRAEGKRCLGNNDGNKEREYIIMGLPVVGGLSAELGSVKKAATMEFDELAKTCPALKARLDEIGQIVKGKQNGERDGFSEQMRSFLESAGEEVSWLKREQERVMEIVKKTADYYHGSEGNNTNPLQLFVVIRDFLAMVDQTCIDITRNMQKRSIINDGDIGGSSSLARQTVQFPHLPPNFMSDKLNNSSESDEEEEEDP